MFVFIHKIRTLSVNIALNVRIYVLKRPFDNLDLVHAEALNELSELRHRVRNIVKTISTTHRPAAKELQESFIFFSQTNRIIFE